MIEVEQLTKRFGSIPAVKGISFSIGKGEVVGLLGPNGAGKTTTMRMLTTYLAPTSGRALLAGYDVLEEPVEVRRKVGYLPEGVPLYPETRVNEYLRFRSQLKDVPRRKRRAMIAEVVAKCGLRDVENRIVGHLSKGYRQRVGLADSMLNDPPILILDEPTAGLDPIQIREVRALIRELGALHTILVSTHIMSEVEAICGRVLLIAGGKLAVDDRLDNLQSDQSILLEVRGPFDAVRSALQATPGVRRVSIVSTEADLANFEILTAEDADLRESIGRQVASFGWGIRQLGLRRRTLEDRFIEAVTRETLAASSTSEPES